MFFSQHLWRTPLAAGFGFHTNLDCRTVAARLIESIQKFRQVVSAALSAEVAQIGKEYTQMVADGVVAAQYLQSWETSASNAVLIARRILSDVKPEFSFQFGSI